MARASPRAALARPQVVRGGIGRFMGETISELRKAVWPSREETVRLTYIVLIIASIIGFILGGLDAIFTQTITRFLFR